MHNDWEKAWNLRFQMRNANVKPTVHVFNAYLVAMERSGSHHDRVILVINYMREFNIEPNETTKQLIHVSSERLKDFLHVDQGTLRCNMLSQFSTLLVDCASINAQGQLCLHPLKKTRLPGSYREWTLTLSILHTAVVQILLLLFVFLSFPLTNVCCVSFFFFPLPMTCWAHIFSSCKASLRVSEF